MSSPVQQRASDPRLDRRALRAEHARVTWWQRLVRARLDLAVAQVTRPDPLGEEMAFQLPLDVGIDVPRPATLADLLPGGPVVDVERLRELRALDTQLALYAAGVEDALSRATDRLIERLAADPHVALAGFPETPSRG
ncbi:hypothetical protein [Cellulomonas fengjieae]|uniref:Uncharacterized protein n=1 Tax=Cellulomonas fengjieae TaxID=2819978 RepID=A0ABS3SCV1_9CELL|nr:hypothetical protein [Cellulomonas fengjieae]MBO3083149.1 hypothetical protein [Cellulomonas fengjieae]QVI65488.1 hypothetical protein KG102_15500 [Cellulomonas fengjieae]